MQDLYGAQLCQASIQSFAQEAALALRPTVGAIAQAVQGSAVVHADETGIRITGRLHCLHSLCNAHHIRELVYIHEQEGQKIWDSWAQEMIDLLLQALREVDAQGAALSLQRQAWFEAQ